MRRFGLPPVAVLAAALLSAPAHAATSVRLEADHPYTLDFRVTLRVFVTSDGEETDNTVFGAVEYPNQYVDPDPLSPPSQASLSTIGTAAPGWQTGALICTTAFCTAFNQININGPQTAGLTDRPIATLTFLVDIDTPDQTVLHFDWRTSPSTQRLDWFGVTDAPGATVTVVSERVPAEPEPATAALLGVGLIGLALARRSRA